MENRRKGKMVYVSKEVEKRLEDIHSVHGTPFSTVINKALEQYFKKIDENKAAYAGLLASGRD